MTRLSLKTLTVLLLASSAHAIPSVSRQDIINIAKTGVGCPYKWGGTCWDPNNKSWKGADCSGYVTVCWQIPKASNPTDCLPHYFTSSAYKSQSTHWSSIGRDDLLEGDALTSGSHVVIYAGGDKWGSAEVYEARGSSYGIVHRQRSLGSSYVARRRDSLSNTSPGPGPGPGTGHPDLFITSSIATIQGQPRDFCKKGASANIFDWLTGQTSEVQVEVTNNGGGVANGVRLGLLVEKPHVKVNHWAIFYRPPGQVFALSAVDGMQSAPRNNPGPSFTLDLTTIPPGGAIRVKIQLHAAAVSSGTGTHPGLRAWIANIDGVYSKQGFWHQPQQSTQPQTFNGGDLKTAVETDVLEKERCGDGEDNNCDGQVDEGCGPGSGPGPKKPGGGTDPNPGSNPGGSQNPDPPPPSPPPGSDPGLVPTSGAPLTAGCALGGGDSSTAPVGMLALLLLLLVALRRR